MSEPLTADPWTPAEEAGMRERLLDEDAVIYAADLARAIATLDAARDRPGLDVERLASDMSAAYTYEDRDNSIPTLLFVDDFEAFWDPFAVKVAARQREGAG